MQNASICIDRDIIAISRSKLESWKCTETRSAIESRVVAAAVGRDDWVILKIVDGNDAGTIIKSRSMPGQSWRVISVRAPRTNAEKGEG